MDVLRKDDAPMTGPHKVAAQNFLQAAQDAAAVLDKTALLTLRLTIRAFMPLEDQRRAVRAGAGAKRKTAYGGPDLS